MDENTYFYNTYFVIHIFFGNFRNFTVKLATAAECIEFPKLEGVLAPAPHS